jgi:antirestriction protein ArdC
LSWTPQLEITTKLEVITMNVYEIITNKILEQLENGVVPWQRPWKVTTPKNFISKKKYRGVNILMLGIQGYACPYWATFNQLKKEGGSVTKGQRGTPVIFWKFRDADEDEERKRRPPILRYYTVFNLEQAEGIEWDAEEEREINPLDTCDQILAHMPVPPKVDYDGGSRAFYKPGTDSVHQSSDQVRCLHVISRG